MLLQNYCISSEEHEQSNLHMGKTKNKTAKEIESHGSIEKEHLSISLYLSIFDRCINRPKFQRTCEDLQGVHQRIQNSPTYKPTLEACTLFLSMRPTLLEVFLEVWGLRHCDPTSILVTGGI